MLKQINYYWRILGTGISFFVFGLGGLLLYILIFPILNILISERCLRIICARNIIHFTFRTFVELMCFLGILRYEIHGRHRLQRSGLLILANHPTLIDTVFMMAFVRQADCIIKSTLWHNPFTRGPVRAAGYICNDNGPSLVDDCIAALRDGSNLIIFPEGTRTPHHGRIKFKRGAAHIAVRSFCNVTPVIIRCIPRMLYKGEKWWKVSPVAARFIIEVQEDINIQTFLASAGNETLAARHLNHYLQDYFMRKNHYHAPA